MVKQTLQNYLKQQEKFYNDHVKFHSPNAFCGSAGEAEMKHVCGLVEELSDAEVVQLVKKAGFPDLVGASDNPAAAREICENVIDEIDREDFYEQYHNIIEARA